MNRRTIAVVTALLLNTSCVTYRICCEADYTFNLTARSIQSGLRHHRITLERDEPPMMTLVLPTPVCQQPVRLLVVDTSDPKLGGARLSIEAHYDCPEDNEGAVQQVIDRDFVEVFQGKRAKKP